VPRFGFLSRLDTDAPSADIPDALDFESDINALASVIAFKEVEPPLAIGLFGNWGTGKSFFMNKLQKRIKRLSGSGVKEYCENVVSINFNSWHYSDSNLWASLITKIFEDLEKFGKGEEDKKKLNKLLENLNSAKELLQEKTQQQEKLKKELEELDKKRTEWTREIDDAVKDLNEIKTMDIIKAVWKDPMVKKDVEELKHRYDFLDLEEYGQVDKNLEELGDGMTRFKETLKLIYSYRNGKLWIALLSALGFFALFTLLMYWAGSAEEVFNQLKYLVGLVAAITSQAVIFMRPLFRKLGGLHERLVNLKRTCDQTAERERQMLMKDMEGLNSTITTKKALKEEIDGKIKRLELEKIAVETELQDIRSGRKIMRFIEGRVTDQRYINSLGIISWIRKDFEELNFLLKQQYDTKKLEELDREKVENVFKVDRVVLYIDDLDRCEATTVVRVLEAIHLLLAFPLFVVVVGVDPRWMHNALNIKYEKFLKKKKADNNGVPMPAADEDIYFIDHPATSFDYLEKIFQIPFVLKPINDTGKKQLIYDQFRMKEEPGKGDEKKEREGEVEKTREGKVMKRIGGEGIADGAAGMESNVVQTARNLERNIDMEKNAGSRPLEEFQRKDRETEKVKEETEDLRNVTRLQVSDEEIDFMQRISFMIGESPRTIKRHINIYRMIRSHSLFKTLPGKEMEYYMSSMVILGILTGVPHLSRSVFTALKSSKDDTLFKAFFSSYMKDQKLHSPVLKNINERLARDKDLEDIGNLKMKVFKANLPLISRFTFRNLS
jgi:hypothetical protein